MIKIGNWQDIYDPYTVGQFKFPAGEVGIRLPLNGSEDQFILNATTVIASIKNSDDIMALLLTNDALKRWGVKNISLKLSYVPYARQDRVTVEGEPLSIAVFAQLINSCNFEHVWIKDPHSDVTPALINNCSYWEQFEIFGGIKTKEEWADTWIVAPDLGAHKKAQKFADEHKCAGVVTCTKVRNPKTGKLSNYRCYDDVQGKNLVVLDDIADGSGTFVLAHKALEGAAKIELMVTHGIFTKGVEVVTDVYDHVYTTTSYYGDSFDVPEKLKNSKITWID